MLPGPSPDSGSEEESKFLRLTVNKMDSYTPKERQWTSSNNVKVVVGFSLANALPRQYQNVRWWNCKMAIATSCSIRPRSLSSFETLSVSAGARTEVSGHSICPYSPWLELRETQTVSTISVQWSVNVLLCSAALRIKSLHKRPGMGQTSTSIWTAHIRTMC